jgi:hypothetical protein
MISDRAKSGIYLAVYLIALGILTWEVIRLYGEVNETFVSTLLTNLQSSGDIIDTITWGALLAIIPVFFLWFFYLMSSLAPPEAKRQMLFCIIPLIVFLLVGLWAIFGLIYMAVTFVCIYLGGVGTAIGGFGDGEKESSLGAWIGLIGVIVGLVLEFANQGLFEILLPLTQYFNLPLLSQDASPNPSGYGIGYYISILSMTYSIYKTSRESSALKGDIVGSVSSGQASMVLPLMMNRLFMLFWILGSVFLMPLLPVQLLNLGFALLYVMGWYTGRKGIM